MTGRFSGCRGEAALSNTSNGRSCTAPWPSQWYGVSGRGRHYGGRCLVWLPA